MMIQRTYQEKISQKILKKPGKKLNRVAANFRMRTLIGTSPRRVQRQTAQSEAEMEDEAPNTIG